MSHMLSQILYTVTAAFGSLKPPNTERKKGIYSQPVKYLYTLVNKKNIYFNQ